MSEIQKQHILATVRAYVLLSCNKNSPYYLLRAIELMKMLQKTELKLVA